MDDLWGSLLSGLLGLVGVLIGSGITLWAQRAERKRRELSAGRALRHELLNNAAKIRQARLDGTFGGYATSSLWEAELPFVAWLFSDTELGDIGSAYSHVDETNELLSKLHRGGGPGLTDPDKATLERHLAEFRLAAEHVQRKAYGPT